MGRKSKITIEIERIQKDLVFLYNEVALVRQTISRVEHEGADARAQYAGQVNENFREMNDYYKSIINELKGELYEIKNRKVGHKASSNSTRRSNKGRGI